MKITVILVEPEYDRNIGYVCRVMANFGFKVLVIVKPKNPIGKDAVKYSKHGIKILKNAKVVNLFEKEIKKYDFVIGSTAIKRRNKGTVRDVLPLRTFSKNLNYYKGKKIALLIGREGIGLTENEISACDVIVSIETGGRYPTMNISHALAILLYMLAERKFIGKEDPVEKSEKEALLKLFARISSKNKNPKLALACFRRLIGRARIKKAETIQLLEAFRLLYEPNAK